MKIIGKKMVRLTLKIFDYRFGFVLIPNCPGFDVSFHYPYRGVKVKMSKVFYN